MFVFLLPSNFNLKIIILFSLALDFIIKLIFINVLPYDDLSFSLTGGYDEISVRHNAIKLLDDDFELYQIQGIVGSLHIITELILFLSFTLFGSFTYFIIIKSFLFYLSVYCLYILISIKFDTRVALIALIYYIYFLPIRFFALTYLRDDLLIYLLLIFSYLFIKYGLKTILLSVPILAVSRVSSVIPLVSLIIYFGGISHKFRGYKSNLVYSFTIFVLILFALYLVDILEWALSYLYLVLSDFNINYFFYFAKAVFGPLPWNVYLENTYDVYLLPWHIFTFVMVPFLLINRKSINNILINRWAIIIMLLPVFPYLRESIYYDAIGPRQWLMMSFFLSLYIFIFRYEKFNSRFCFLK